MNLERWNKFTLYQKLGNIGSEVARARVWEEKQDTASRNLALERVLEMLDATLNGDLPASGKKELARIKEIIGSWFVGGKDIEYSPRLLENYFTDFSYITR